MWGDNYLVTTLVHVRVVAVFFFVVVFFWGGEGGLAISVLADVACRMEDCPGTDTSGNQGRGRTRRYLSY